MKKNKQDGNKYQKFYALFFNAGFDLLFASATFFVVIEFAEDSMLTAGLLAAIFLVGMLKWRRCFDCGFVVFFGWNFVRGCTYCKGSLGIQLS